MSEDNEGKAPEPDEAAKPPDQPKPTATDSPTAKADTGLPPTRDEALQRLRGDASQLSSVRSGKIISEMISRQDGTTPVNVFQGDFFVEGDFVGGAGAGRPTSRRRTKIRLDPEQLAEAAGGYVPPVGFDAGVDLLDRTNLVIFSGPARTGRYSRATASLVAVLQKNDLDLEVLELSGNVLGNLAWRVPQRRCGLIVVDRPNGQGKAAAESVDDKWLTYIADQLREHESYLVVVTGPVRGTLATAPGRGEYVLEDLELPDPVEIARRLVATEVSWLSEQEINDRIDATRLAEILDERDDPRFAVRAARAVVDALRTDADLDQAVAQLHDPKEQVREWLGAEPDLAEVAFVLATAVLEGSTYLKVADAGVALYRELSTGSATATPRYLRRLMAERTWIELIAHPDDPDGPPVTRFRHADLPGAVLAVTWSELDGARTKILQWLTKLAESADVEVRARAAVAAGILANGDFDHGLYKYLLPWAAARSPELRQSAASGLGVAGSTGGHTEAVWTHIERWVELVHYNERERNLPATAALAAGGPLGVANPQRALRVLRVLACDGDWGFLTPAAQSILTLLAAGRVTHVLDALLDWSEAKVTDESVIKALTMFAFAVREEGPAEDRPLLLDEAPKHREALPELWGRALDCEPVRPLALEALEAWVRWTDRDPSARSVVLSMIGGIAERGDMDYGRVRHALRQWAEDNDNPSDSAVDFYNELVEAGERTA
ncbi:MAG TPA: hypothetical protein VEO01_41635 [Pseudonocardiaceae bacterium]|nr:hypothetical protein [Pseudonocardiaceae bacterium]